MNVEVGTVLETELNKYIITDFIDDGGNGTVWPSQYYPYYHS